LATETLPATTEPTVEGRKLALLRAIGLDRVSPDQRSLALNIAQRYELDLLMKHLVLIDGRPYITRDGLLHVAHRSGQLDGITTSEPAVIDGFWRATASVFRKDMSHPFTYTGRYPTSGGNQKFAPEMAVKVAEVMALRRAFDVAAPTAEERWDAEVPAEPAPPPQSLAERAAQVRASIHATEATAEPGAPADAADGASVLEPAAEPPAPTSPVAQEASAEPPNEADAAGEESMSGASPAPTLCGEPSVYNDGDTCNLAVGHRPPHRILDGRGKATASW